MRNLGVILLSIILLVGLFPQLTIAAQNDDFEQELTLYLEELSNERGFEVTKEDIEESLASYSEKIEDYKTVEELVNGLGEVIKADLSNLDYIYELYELDEERLNALLAEYGETVSDYIFVYDLGDAIYFYQEDRVIEQDPNFEQNLVDYLAKVSELRGFEVTKEDVEDSLISYQTKLEEFETVEDLSDFLGDVIKADLSNLDFFQEKYGLDKQSILQLLEENGDDINDFVYIEDLDGIVWASNEEELPQAEEEMLAELLPIILEQIDLTEEELNRLGEHFMSIEDYLSNPDTLDRLNKLGERFMAFANITQTPELSEEQFAEIESMYGELLSIFKLDLKYSLIKDGLETPLSLIDLSKIKDLKGGASVKVQLYSTDSQFLADIIITSELLSSLEELIGDSAEEIIEIVQQPSITKPEKQNEVEIKTVKGAILPKTASNYIPNTLMGLFIVFAGILMLMYRKVKNAKG